MPSTPTLKKGNRMNGLLSLPTRKNLAPRPQRGNARRVFECLDELGDWANETWVAQLSDGIKHSEKMSLNTSIKQTITYLIHAGYIVWRSKGRGKEYKIAPLHHFQAYQGELTTSKRVMNTEPKGLLDQPTLPLSDIIRDMALVGIWVAMIAHLVIEFAL